MCTLLSILLVHLFRVVCRVAVVFMTGSYSWLYVGILRYALLVSCVLCSSRRFLVFGVLLSGLPHCLVVIFEFWLLCSCYVVVIFCCRYTRLQLGLRSRDFYVLWVCLMLHPFFCYCCHR